MRSGPPRAPGERWRAPYAADPARSRGRLHPETPSPTRSEFQRDRDRVVHSAAFRRLTDKTQVFIHHEGDHFRTRLTHSLEVSQIARAISRSLGLDEDLAETVSLAHDLGHTPFGHTGEDALRDCLAPFGGFDHNAQTLRLLTRLERRYAHHDGLNLTAETLEGVSKHNGPLLDADGRPAGRYRERGVPEAFLAHDRLQPLDLTREAPAEAQAAALADDIAYDAHDLDDGLRSGILRTGDLEGVPFLADLLREIDEAAPGLAEPRRIHELTRRVITRLVEGAIGESEDRLAALAPASVDDIRAAGRRTVAFPSAIAEADRAIKAFLFPALYHHPRLMKVRRDADAVVRDLYGRLTAEPSRLPADWREGLESASEARVARRVGDYIAGMTDGYALAEHRRLFPTTPDLRLEPATVGAPGGTG